MKFTSEDLMKALGLQAGDKIKYYNQVFTITEELNYVGFENDTGCYNIYVLLDKDFEILPKPKRVGDLECDDFSGCDAGCPLMWLCCNNTHNEHNCDITLYEVLDHYRIDDKEVYDLFKNRLDKEVVEE